MEELISLREEATKPRRVKNSRYRQFLDKNEINIMGFDEFGSLINCISGTREIEGRAFCIALFLTGARPNEVLRIRGKDIEKKGSYIVIALKASKGGLPRKMFISRNKANTKEITRELYKYSRSMHSDAYIFNSFISRRKTLRKGKTGKITTYIRITDRLNYWFNKWFDGEINPYFFRHNRFSSMAENGADLELIRQIKGAKGMSSVFPYLHLSTKKAKSAAKYI